MVEQSNQQPRRRPGPVSFRAESQITSVNLGDAPNRGEIGEASVPRMETPTGSRELKVRGPLFWSVVGVFIAIVGLFVSLYWTAVGIGICLASVLTWRMNRTSRRLRSEVRNVSMPNEQGSTQ